MIRRQLLITFLVCAALAVSSSVMAATRTWTGTTSALWSVAGNWGGTAPVAGDDLVFPTGPSTLSTSNDFAPGTGFNSITFTGSGYTLAGNSIALGAGGIVVNLSSSSTVTIALPLTLAAMRTIAFSGAGFTNFMVTGLISGAGGLTVTGGASGSGLQFSNTNTYSGGTSAAGVGLSVMSNSSFGTGTISIAPNTTMAMGVGTTLANSLNVQGCGLSGNAAINGSGVLNGPMSVSGAQVCVGGVSETPSLTFNGVITGSSLLIAPLNTSTSVVVLNASSPSFTGVLQPGTGTLIVNGVFSNAAASFNASPIGATLGGSGTIGGSVTVQTGQNLAPGASPGLLSTGNLDLQSGSIYRAELSGTTAGTGYDQTNVTGTVTLGGGTLNVTTGFVPANGNQFTIINNDGADAVSGTFAGLAQGTSFVVSGNTLSISYTGGTGNDVVVTVVTSVPTLPRGVMWTLAAALLGIGALALRRRLA